MSWQESLNRLPPGEKRLLHDNALSASIGKESYGKDVIARSLLLLGYRDLQNIVSVDRKRLVDAGFDVDDGTLQSLPWFDGTSSNGHLDPEKRKEWFEFDLVSSKETPRRLADHLKGENHRTMAQKIYDAAKKEGLSVEEPTFTASPDHLQRISEAAGVPPSVMRNSIFVQLKVANGNGNGRARRVIEPYTEGQAVVFDAECLRRTMAMEKPYLTRKDRSHNFAASYVNGDNNDIAIGM